MKKQYYSLDNLEKVDATYKLLIGQRANGKSYQVKLKRALEKAFKQHKKFIYLRRWEKDIKQDAVTDYFGDMPVLSITGGQYVGVTAYQGYIYFYNLDDEGKIVRGEKIGRYCALRLNERYKSQVFDGYEDIIYEEFITDELYLDDEPRKLMQFVSTVFRHNKGTVWLIGNTLSRVCPYFAEWCLTGTLRQKPGTIELYHFNVNEEVINVAVEYCANTNYKNTMFFGQAAKQIVSGEWDVNDMPKLPGEQEEYENVYKVLVKYQDFKFCMNLLVDKNGGRIVFIHPQTTSTKFDRILTDDFSVNPLISARLQPKRKAEAYIQDCFRQNKVCYSDNLTGTDFKHVNEHFAISPLF